MSYKQLTFEKEARFLVTGAAGFIGSNICEAILAMGYHVRGLDDFSRGKQVNMEGFIDHPRFEFIEGDLKDAAVCEKACEGITYVLHQGAWGSVPRSIEMPLAYDANNVGGTLNMLEAAVKNQVKKFVYASSSSIYGDNTVLPQKENTTEGQLLSPYAFTKHANEQYAKLYTNLYGLDTYGLRYFNVFGKRQDPEGAYAPVIPKFLKSLLNNEAPTINGDGTQSRDFTYIDNVIDANLKACLAPSHVAGEAFNIAYGGQETLLSLYDAISTLIQKQDIKPVFGPPRTGDLKHSRADISKAKEMLGYDPQYSFAEGLKLCVEWYKENV